MAHRITFLRPKPPVACTEASCECNDLPFGALPDVAFSQSLLCGNHTLVRKSATHVTRCVQASLPRLQIRRCRSTILPSHVLPSSCRLLWDGYR